MSGPDASDRVAMAFVRRDGLFPTGVAGLILGMDQGRFEQQTPRVAAALRRSAS